MCLEAQSSVDEPRPVSVHWILSVALVKTTFAPIKGRVPAGPRQPGIGLGSPSLEHWRSWWWTGCWARSPTRPALALPKFPLPRLQPGASAQGRAQCGQEGLVVEFFCSELGPVLIFHVSVSGSPALRVPALTNAGSCSSLGQVLGAVAE